MKSYVFAQTTSGLPILAHQFGERGAQVLVLGGVHGDETEGIWASHALLGHLLKNYDLNLRLTLVPIFNLDGALTRERRNARMVDLNRNLPTADWSPKIATERYHPGASAGSESENHGLLTYLEKVKPQFILSLHSWKPLLNPNGDCLREAEAMARSTGYKIEPDIGYPTPGSLGSFGQQHGIAVLTYEIERGLDRDSVIRAHLPAILNGLKASEHRS